MPQHLLDKELETLWIRRDRLTEPEWARLREIVFLVLSKRNFSHYGSLQGYPQEDLIEDFFTRKVFEPVTKAAYQAARAMHAGALCAFFVNFLNDAIDVEHREPASSALGVDDPEAALRNHADCAKLDEGGIKAILDAAGLSVDKVAQSAERFLAGSEEWVRVYLGMHYCPDDDEAVPLIHVAARWEIPSHHHRAVLLGITWPRGGFQNYDQFSATLLGGWVTGLGIRVDVESIELIETALKMLCVAALKMMEGIRTPPGKGVNA